jgi:hypothetical protein
MLLLQYKPSTFVPNWRITMIKKSLIGAAVAASLFALSAPASATLSNWYLDTDGAGGNASVQVGDYLDLTGTSFVHNTFTGSSFTFNEVGNFLVLTADGSTLLAPSLTAKFVGTGSGNLGGNLTFNTGGTLTVFSGTTDIGDFTLQLGSAVLNAGTVLPAGAISFIFKATHLTAGYFFDQNNQDLSLVANDPDGLLLGFATTGVITSNSNIPNGLIADYNTAFNPDLTGPITPNGLTDLNLSNNGQFRLEVPEPSMLSLLGLALVGFGFTTRRKSKV